MEQVKPADIITDKELLLQIRLTKLELEAKRRGLTQIRPIPKPRTKRYHQAQVIEPQLLQATIQNKEKFKVVKHEIFQDASLKLYIKPQLEYDEYSGGYKKFLDDFDPLNKGIILILLKKYPTFKINYCFHVQFHKQYQDGLNYIEQVYETDNFEYMGIESYDDKYDLLREGLTTWIQEREEGESGYSYDDIVDIDIGIARTELLKGGTYIPTPFKCNTILNIENNDSQDCFELSVIAHFFPAP